MLPAPGPAALTAAIGGGEGAPTTCKHGGTIMQVLLLCEFSGRGIHVDRDARHRLLPEWEKQQCTIVVVSASAGQLMWIMWLNTRTCLDIAAHRALHHNLHGASLESGDMSMPLPSM
eukprot:4432210-Amphidinium_carterae.1